MAADSSHPRFQVHQLEQGITHVVFKDANILDEAVIQQIGDGLKQLIEASGNPKLLLDFTHVQHLSSAALGTLITVERKLRDQGGQLRLVHINKQIYEVFQITKLNKLFQIHDKEAKALKSFK